MIIIEFVKINVLKLFYFVAALFTFSAKNYVNIISGNFDDINRGFAAFFLLCVVLSYCFIFGKSMVLANGGIYPGEVTWYIVGWASVLGLVYYMLA